MKLFKKILPHYIHHRNYINKGNSEVTTVRHIVQVVLIAKVAYTSLPSWVLILGGCIIVAAYWCVGWTWDSIKGYDTESEWGNKRNPFCKSVEEKLK